LWAICWAGSKPLASFFDGWLASVVPHLWIAAVALALPAALLAFAEIVLPKRIKRWIRGQAFRVGITSSPAVVSIPLDDRQPSPKRLGSPNGVRVTSVTNAPPFNGHATGQLTHHPSKVPTARSTHSPYHHQRVR